MINPQWLELSTLSGSNYQPSVARTINPQWLELSMSRTNFHGPKDVRAIDVWRFIYSSCCFSSFSINICYHISGNLGKVPSNMCVRQRLKSVCASTQSDQSLRCPHEETLHPWLSKICPVKILIRLRECAGWSESSLGAHVRRYVVWNCDSYDAQDYWFAKGRICSEVVFH